MLATLLVMCLVYDSPAVHPRVGAEEKQFLLSFQLQSQSKVILITSCLIIKRIDADIKGYLLHEKSFSFFTISICI